MLGTALGALPSAMPPATTQKKPTTHPHSWGSQEALASTPRPKRETRGVYLPLSSIAFPLGFCSPLPMVFFCFVLFSHALLNVLCPPSPLPNFSILVKAEASTGSPREWKCRCVQLCYPHAQNWGGTEAAPSSKGLLEVFTPSLTPCKWQKGMPEHPNAGESSRESSSRDSAPSSKGDGRGASCSASVAAGGFSFPFFWGGGGRRGSSVLTDPNSPSPVAQVQQAGNPLSSIPVAGNQLGSLISSRKTCAGKQMTQSFSPGLIPGLWNAGLHLSRRGAKRQEYFPQDG